VIIEYYKTRDNVITPERANPSDAGLDVFFCPSDGEAIYLKPGDTALFQTGLRFGVPHGYMLEVKNRSGNASKRSFLWVLVLLILVMTEKYLLIFIM
jgi:dUTPase